MVEQVYTFGITVPTSIKQNILVFVKVQVILDKFRRQFTKINIHIHKNYINIHIAQEFELQILAGKQWHS